MLKGTKLYSILNNKCPKCHQGDFFVTKGSYNKDFIKMHDKCPHCGEIFNKEVGFYYGAMYVSYGVNIGIGIGLFLLMVLIFNLSLLTYLFSFFGLVVLLFPWVMRISRLIYINLFVKFDFSKK
ncbi:MAG: DUF983 domain-containing protein [Bacteroidia bacterium]|nr:DUF983 domain-containing protein [Bacteroidia bacterium]